MIVAPQRAGMMVTAGAQPPRTMTPTHPLGSALKLVRGAIQIWIWGMFSLSIALCLFVLLRGAS